MAAALILYVVAMFGVALWARRRVHGEDDFLVAGRSLSLPLASATLLATWFGAGTMLTAADEIRRGGLERIALEPLGSGVCLLLAGFWLARPLWRMGLLTVADFFRRRYGPRSEAAAAVILVPSYFGWIAVQYLALAGMLEVVFGLNPTLGVLLVAAVSAGYTWLGGMWSVTLTDAIQVVLLLAGLVALGWAALAGLGEGNPTAGAAALWNGSPPGYLVPLPVRDWGRLLEWFNVFCIAALGNLPAQDLLQRVFAARSESVARRACWLAGTGYLVFGSIPVLLGLASLQLLPGSIEQAVVPALAQAFLHPALSLVFVITLASAILSTLDSALLAPASVLGHNLLPLVGLGPADALRRTRWAVLGVAAASLAVAYLGESAYSLLEDAYALPLVGLLVPLGRGLKQTAAGEGAALWSMGAGVGLWLLHFGMGWEVLLGRLPVPAELSAVAAAWLVYEWTARRG